ncbi:MAG: hypothetical protein HRT94_09440, partial [Alphaproteobacteria bacterium]|nr:hypothetical protein [Alphaproteobacteria bacterium]
MGAGDWLRRQLGGRFGAASKNGGDTTPNTSLAERIKLLETNLDKFTGDLLEGNNAVSKDVKDTVGRVQAATIALIKAYDAGDEAAKKALKDSGFIKEWQGNAEFNAGQIFGISKGVGNFPTLEEKTRAVAIAIEAKVKELGVTDAQLQEGLAINNTRGGANPDPAASTATPITPIYSALDPNLGAASKAIAGIHIAMRSGVGRILSGAPDQNAATKAQKTNFNGKIFEDDPAYMKRMLKSGTRLNAHERGEEPEILPEDVDNIRAGMQEAIANLRVAGAALGKNADLSAIVQQAEKYTELVNGIDSVTPRYKANPAKQRGLFVGDEEEEEVTVADNPLASLDGVLKALEAQQETAADDAAAKTKAAFNQTKTGQEGQYQIQEIKQQKAFLNAYVGAVGEKNVAQEG